MTDTTSHPGSPYRAFVSELARLNREALRCNPTRRAVAPSPLKGINAPKVLIFAPHPDDESIIGAFPLRLHRETNMNVLAVAVTLGSKTQRRRARLEEMKAACGFLGFGLLQLQVNGLERVNLNSRESDPIHWSQCVASVVTILNDHRPQVIFVPHDDDWNSTHVGVHYLVLDALATITQSSLFRCFIVDTEYWRCMRAPNLLVQSSESDVADLVNATALHVGEVQRNAYHILLPAWMQDNIRRGAEIVGHQGGDAPDFQFGTLYHVRRWTDGKLTMAYTGGRHLSLRDNPTRMFDEDLT